MHTKLNVEKTEKKDQTSVSNVRGFAHENGKAAAFWFKITKYPSPAATKFV